VTPPCPQCGEPDCVGPCDDCGSYVACAGEAHDSDCIHGFGDDIDEHDDDDQPDSEDFRSAP
jgi:hypothetical protein